MAKSKDSTVPAADRATLLFSRHSKSIVFLISMLRWWSLRGVFDPDRRVSSDQLSTDIIGVDNGVMPINQME